MILSGMSTYTGDTTISSGSISVSAINNAGNPGNLGGGTNIVFDGGTLQYTGANANTDRNFSITAGKTAFFDITTNNLTISGSSLATTEGLTKSGLGTLALAGTNLYTGPTTISGGTLALSGPGSLANSTAVNLPNSGTTFDISGLFGSGQAIGSLNGVTGSFVILGSKNLTLGGLNTADSYAGEISGLGGSFTKTGSGAMTLSGSNSYSGGTAIDSGTLRIANSNALGTGNVAHNSATLDIGLNTLNIGGTYIQNGASTLMVDINGTFNGSIVSAGPATVSATDTLALNVSSFIPPNATYVIIDGGAGGHIAAPIITVSGSMAQFIVTMTGDDLVLTSYRQSNYLASSAQNANARAVGTVLDNMTNPSSDMTQVIDVLDDLPPAQANAALNTMYAEIDGGIMNVTGMMLNNFVSVALSRVEKIRSSDEESSIDPWVKGYGSYLTQGKRHDIHGYNAWNTGAMAGEDGTYRDSVVLGLSGGYAYSQVGSNTVNTEKTLIHSAQITAYGGYGNTRSPFYVDAAGYFAYNWYSGLRDINIGDVILRTAHSNYHGMQYGVYAGAGCKVRFQTADLTPLISLQWNHLAIDNYSERGANSLNLSVRKQNYDQLRTGLGARIAFSRQFSWGLLTPEFHARWFYDFIDDAMAVTSNFNGGGAAFPTNGAKPAQNSGNLGAMLIFDTNNDNISIYGNIDTEIRSRFLGIYGSIAINYAF